MQIYLILHGDRASNISSIANKNDLPIYSSRNWSHGGDHVSILGKNVIIKRVEPSVHSEATSLKGSHHPKKVLIFTSKNLHVSISTSNLTQQESIDACWSQSFPRKNYHELSSTQTCDFGLILEDFLRRQSANICHQNSTNSPDANKDFVMEWIQMHAIVNNLVDCFDFSDAKVFLL
jgi:hypothetical protein